MNILGLDAAIVPRIYRIKVISDGEVIADTTEHLYESELEATRAKLYKAFIAAGYESPAIRMWAA